MDLPPLEEVLKHIPAANRHRLDEKLEDRRSRVKIAKSLRSWQTLAQFIPNIQNDIDGIEHDNKTLELQKIALLDKWLERNGPWATYHKLAEYLYEAGAIEALQVLCKELGGDLQQGTATAATNKPNPPKCSSQVPRPTKRDLIQYVKVSNPYNLGLNLNLDEVELNVVRVNYPNDHGRQLSDVFTIYLQRAEEPSWTQVVTALRAMGENHLARTIKTTFGLNEAMLTSQPNVLAEQQEASSGGPSPSSSIPPDTGIRDTDPSAVRVQHSSASLTTPETRAPLHLEEQGDVEAHPPAQVSPPNNGPRRRVQGNQVGQSAITSNADPPPGQSAITSNTDPPPKNKSFLERITIAFCVVIIFALLAYIAFFMK